jgi:hypothetical protein
MVEAVLAYSTHEALGVRVRTRRTDRSADGLDTDRGEYLVEAGGELGVPVADEEAEWPFGLLEVGGEVAGHLGHPGGVRVGGDSEDVHGAAFHLDDEQHVVAPKVERVDVEKSVATMPLAWAERNWAQVGPSRRGAGGRPWRRSTVPTLVFDTHTPSFFSSPTMRS